MTTIPPPPTKPWTKLQFQAALRRAGWKRIPGPNPIYQSPDDETVRLHLDRYQSGRGFLWEYYAIRNELPATTRPPF